jgi:hypothetical protein
MSQDHKEIGRLLKSIEFGLKKYSVHELNKAIAHVLEKNINHSNALNIEYVLKVVADDFDIPKSKLVEKTWERGKVREAKSIAFCLLHYFLEISIRDIATNIFKCYPNTVVRGIKKLRDADIKIKDERIFWERYVSLQEKLTHHFSIRKPVEHIEHENIS